MKNSMLAMGIVCVLCASISFGCGGPSSKSAASKSVAEFHDYINTLSEKKALGDMYLNNSKLWQGEAGVSFYPFSSRIDTADLVAHTEETLELKKKDANYRGYGKIWYHMGTFKTEENAKDAETILQNRIRPGKREGHTQVVSEIYRNGREIFFILVGRDVDRKLVSPEIRNKGRELIGLK